jgi:hypothetical protein
MDGGGEQKKEGREEKDGWDEVVMGEKEGG